MRLFQKRRDAVGTEQAQVDPRLDRDYGAEYYHGDSGFHQGDRIPPFQDDLVLPYSRDEQQLLNHANANTNTNTNSTPVTPTENEHPKNRQSIVGLVRKLNCSSSSSKKHDESFRQYPTGVGEDGGIVAFGGDEGGTNYGTSSSNHNNSNNNNNNNNSQNHKVPAGPQRVVSPPRRTQPSDITRPVLITVKDSGGKQILGSSDRKHNNNNSNNGSPTETSSSFVVGEMPPRKSSFRLGLSARKRQHNEKESNRDGGGDNRTESSGYHDRNKNKNSSNTTTKDTNKGRSAQDLARRQRWKRGLEMELFRNSSIVSKRYNDKNRESDDSSWSDTTGTSYDDTTENSSSVDDWTIGSTDESRVSPRRRRSSTGGECFQNEKLVRSLAKDVGIIASFFMADGYACLGTAAAITKETVASCRENGF